MRQAWDEAIGTSPVSTVDVDQVVAKGRRHGVRRRMAVVGAAGGTMVAAVGIVAALTFTSTPTTTATGPSLPGLTGAPTQAQPAASTGAAPVRASETLEQARLRVEAALRDGLTAALPGVQLEGGSLADDEFRFSGDVVLTTASGHSQVFLTSAAGGTEPPAATPSDWPTGQPAPPIEITWVESCAILPTPEAEMGDGHRGGTFCEESIGAGGQTIVAVTERCLDCSTPSVYRYDVYVTWTNARVGLGIARDLKRGGGPSGSVPLLSLEQLVAIAADPELTITS